MTSSDDSSTLSFDNVLNTKLIQKLVEFSEAHSSSTKESSRGRRNGVFIAVEDIPLDLEGVENLISDGEEDL
jgi:hypothetical protein